MGRSWWYHLDITLKIQKLHRFLSASKSFMNFFPLDAKATLQNLQYICVDGTNISVKERRNREICFELQNSFSNTS